MKIDICRVSHTYNSILYISNTQYVFAKWMDRRPAAWLAGWTRLLNGPPLHGLLPVLRPRKHSLSLMTWLVQDLEAKLPWERGRRGDSAYWSCSNNQFDHERYCNIPCEGQRLGAQEAWRSSELLSMGQRGKGWKEVGWEVKARRWKAMNAWIKSLHGVPWETSPCRSGH